VNKQFDYYYGVECGSVVIPFDNQISKDTDLFIGYIIPIFMRRLPRKKEIKSKCRTI